MKTAYQTKRQAGFIGKLPDMNLAPIRKVLGDDTPMLEPSRVGRFRLTQALRNRYGVNYKNHPDAQYALAHFDHESTFIQLLAKIRGENGT